MWDNGYKQGRITVELSKEYLIQEISKINDLLFSGSLDQVDEASRISARLIGELNG